jgi:uncharacterized repeat protein (TIGR03803 family)
MFSNSLPPLWKFVSSLSSIARRTELPSRRFIVVVALSCATLTLASTAQTFRTLVTFSGSGQPYDSPLIQGTDGHFYGTTSSVGTVFKITPGGTLTTLYTFCSQPKCADGRDPSGALVQGADGNFYGTTREGGTATGNQNAQGTVYKLSPQGVLTSLYTFLGPEGGLPIGGLIQGADGDFYGTTDSDGGAGYQGTFFKISSAGALTTLYRFPVGFAPASTLVLGSDGNFYGDTEDGSGTGCYEGEGCGTAFKITPSGEFTTLTTLQEPDGNPQSGLTWGADGNLYGTATTPQVGAVFEVTTAGSLSTVYTFGLPSGGEKPIAGLVLGTDGNFYGTTSIGGIHRNSGTIFELTPSGTLTTLHDFDGSTDGSYPVTTLMQSTNGIFYGMTSGGGANNLGTIFSISTGLGPFVTPRPTSGEVGKAVTILGTNLTGTTAVSFNGTPATFTANGSAINTTVPAGATTGTITVTTSSGTLSSNVVFTITD